MARPDVMYANDHFHCGAWYWEIANLLFGLVSDTAKDLFT